MQATPLTIWPEAVPSSLVDRFSFVVQEFGTTRNTTDHLVFYHHTSSGQCIYLIVFVDDIIIMGNDEDGI